MGRKRTAICCCWGTPATRRRDGGLGRTSSDHLWKEARLRPSFLSFRSLQREQREEEFERGAHDSHWRPTRNAIHAGVRPSRQQGTKKKPRHPCPGSEAYPRTTRSS